MKTINTTLLAMLMYGQFAFAEATITIGTDENYPPYHSLNEDKEFVGFEVDLAKKVCKVAELDCEFKFQDFSTLLSSVRFKKYDIAMSAFGDSMDRKRVVDFTLPYMDGGVDLNINTNEVNGFCQNCPKVINIDAPAERKMFTDALVKALKGKAISFERNTIMDKFFDNNPSLKQEIDIIYGKNPDDIRTMLLSGKVAMAIGASETNADHIQASKVKAYGGEFGHGYAIVIRKEDQALKQKLDDAIKQLNEDGTIKTLSEKWFNEDKSPKI